MEQNNINRLRNELKKKFIRQKNELCFKFAIEQSRLINEIEHIRTEIYNLRAKLVRFGDETDEGDIKKATDRLYALRCEKVELNYKLKNDISDMKEEYSRQLADLDFQSEMINCDNEPSESSARKELISSYEKDGLKIEVSRVYPVEGSGDDIAYDISVSSLDNGLLQGSIYLNSIEELYLLKGAITSFIETKEGYGKK